MDNIAANLVADSCVRGDIWLGFIEDEEMSNWGYAGDEPELEAEEYELNRQREYEQEQMEDD